MTAPPADLQHWEIPNRVRFESGPGGLIRLAITTPLASALVYLHGAHIAHFQPAGAVSVLFLSAESMFASGKAIRGGVPVIFPWFGSRAGNPSAPMHGFARTTAWEVESLDSAGEVITIVLRLNASEQTRAHWPHEFILRHRIVIGTQLEMSLEVENTGIDPFEFEEALHTYLAVADVREASVRGLSGVEFLDKVDALTRKKQDAKPISITGETDRVYLHTAAACVIDDPIQSRQIAVDKTGSDTTVVWNPWIAKAKAMADFGDDEWPQMLCVETANAGENSVTLAPRAKHVMQATIGLS